MSCGDYPSHRRVARYLVASCEPRYYRGLSGLEYSALIDADIDDLSADIDDLSVDMSMHRFLAPTVDRVPRLNFATLTTIVPLCLQVWQVILTKICIMTAD